MVKLSNPSNDAVYFDNAECLKETDKAILVIVDDLGIELWIPKSQIHDDSEVFELGDNGKLAIKQWFARKEGLA